MCSVEKLLRKNHDVFTHANLIFSDNFLLCESIVTISQIMSIFQKVEHDLCILLVNTFEGGYISTICCHQTGASA